MKLKKNIMFQLCLILGLTIMVSCNSDSNPASVGPQQEEPPQVPTSKSIAFDLSYFDSVEASQVGENYQQASEVIKKIQFIQARSIEPVRNLLENADTTNAKVLEEGKKWQWKYTPNKQGRLNYSIRLVAIKKKADKIKWKVFMNILPQEKQSQEVLFITGTTNRKVTEGTWTYNTFGQAGQPQQNFATLNWKIQEEGIHMELKIIADMQFQGSKIIYDADGKIRTIILNSTDGSITTIKYSVKTNAGFIESPNYNNGKRACWNSNFEDVDCNK